MTEAHIPLGPLRLALVDLTGAPDEHLVRIEITEDRVFIRAWGANPEKGLMAIRKTFEIEQRSAEEIETVTRVIHDGAAEVTILEEFHEETPPDWVPPQLIRMWDKCTPEQRRAMKEELELQQAEVKKDDDDVEGNRDPVQGPDREDP